MKKAAVFLEMIRFEHTIFALPFAYVGMVLAWGSWENANWSDFIWITVAMGAARTAAMAFNRYIDRVIDIGNPRTASRPIQVGAIDARSVLAAALLSTALLALAAWMLDPLALILFPGALVFLIGYSFTKRFTWLSHYVLGFTDGLAPMGAWVGVTGSVFTAEDLPAWLLLGSVTLWIGGFDIIYACQDLESDLQQGLHSIPARFGAARGLMISRLSHVATMALLVGIGFLSSLSWPYWVGLAVIAGLLIYEHRLVSPDDFSKINVAFFNINGYISISLFAATFFATIAG